MSAPPELTPSEKRYFEELDKQCPILPVSNTRRLMEYFVMAQQLWMQAQAYDADSRDAASPAEAPLEPAYIMYKRYAFLCIKTIPKHNGYRLPTYRREHDKTRRNSGTAIERLQELKQLIVRKLRGEHAPAATESGAASVPVVPTAPPPPSVPAGPSEPVAPSAPPPSYPGDAAMDGVAAGLASASISAPPPPGPPAFPGDATAASNASPYSSLSSQLPPGAEAAAPSAAPVTAPPPAAPGALAAMPYASLQAQIAGGASVSAAASAAWTPPAAGAAAPAYSDAAYGRSLSTTVGAPACAGSGVVLRTATNGMGDIFYERPCPGLRKLVLPSKLPAQFLLLAQPNTQLGKDGIETLGVLAGSLRKGVMRVTHVILPKQQGVRDSCHMTDEGEVSLFDYCDSEQLMTLGWIHTHPSQCCFMSSLDVHTQCGYQSMLPESVAIVMAPRDRRLQMGVFRLTEPDGLKLVQRCTLTGFHKHPEGVELYQLSPHVEFEPGAHLSVVDLRR